METLTILIVDDNQRNRFALRAVLEAENHTTHEAADGVAALAVLERVPVDVVVSDLFMPRMDGYRLCHELRQSPRLCRMPFIACSGTFTALAEQALALQLGADVALTKPVSTPALLAALPEARQRAAGRQQVPMPEQPGIEAFQQYNIALVTKLEEQNAEQKRSNERLEASQAQLRFLANHAPVLIAHYDAERRYKFVNQAYAEMFGQPPAGLVGWHAREVLGAATYAEVSPRMEQVLAGERVEFEMTLPGLTAGPRDAFVTYAPERNEAGQVVGFVAAILDITQRRQAEREVEVRFRQLAEGLPQLIWTCQPDGPCDYLSPQWVAYTGIAEAEQLGTGWLQQIHPDDRASLMQAWNAAVVEGSRFDVQFRIRRHDGVYRWFRTCAAALRDSADRVVKWFGSNTDVDDLKQTEARLVRFQSLVEASTDFIGIAAPDQRMLYLNRAGRAMVGLAPEVEVTQTCIADYHPDGVLRLLDEQVLPTLLSHGTWAGELAFKHRSGREIPVSTVAVAHDGPDGAVEFLAVMARDITEHREAEAARERRAAELSAANLSLQAEIAERDRVETALRRSQTELEASRQKAERAWEELQREVVERQQVEEQLRQSQKLEAIGQLAGGVAHDFNNILGAMMLQVEITSMEKSLNEDTQEALRQIQAGAERAANLTRQLLFFSRKQVLQARDLDLNDSVTGMAKLLQRLIGEDVRLELRPHPVPLLTHADAGMLDQVLLNLAVNARDAMPGGGRLIIETGEKTVDAALAEGHLDRTPGRYVWVGVTDNGSGIPPEVLPRIFEPFFTTKEAGKGTGLGLATVFGIVKQHQGWLTVASELGQGTTFHVFFPALDRAATVTAAARPKPRGGTETLLLVEDDQQMRMLAQSTLERHGYQVREAPSGAQALQRWPECRDTVALLLTDLVMPEGVGGLELARRLQADQPRLKVVFMTGYSPELAGRELHLQEGQNFLQKPFSPYQLLETVRRALDA